MIPPRLATDLVPVHELRAHLAEWLDHIDTTGRPVVVTQRGRATAVLIRPEDLDELHDSRELTLKVLRGLREEAKGELIDDADVWAEVDASLSPAKH